MTDNFTYEELEGLRRSDLWQIHETPQKFKYYMEHKNEIDSPALRFGIAVHKLILEPETFNDEIVIEPGFSRRTVEGRRQYEEFTLGTIGKTIISPAEYDKALQMAEALKQNKLAVELLDGKHEQVYTWLDAGTGIKLKMKADCITEYDGELYIVDYKTTDSVADGHFERSCRKFGYYFQTGFYTEGLFNNTFENYRFAYVAQEKIPPYASRVYFCDESFIEYGQQQFHQLLGIYKSCLDNDNWYGYEPCELLGE